MSILKEDDYNIIRLRVKIPKKIRRGQNFKVILPIILMASLQDWRSGPPPLGLGPCAASGTSITVLKLSKQHTLAVPSLTRKSQPLSVLAFRRFQGSEHYEDSFLTCFLRRLQLPTCPFRWF